MRKLNIIFILLIISVLLNLFLIAAILKYAGYLGTPLNVEFLFKKSGHNLASNGNIEDSFIRSYIVDEEYGSDSFRIFPEKKYPYIKRNKIKIDYETRNAFFIPPSQELKTTVKIDEPCFLDFGVYLLAKAPYRKARAKVFLDVSDRKKEYRLLSKLLKYDAIETKRWFDFRIDLSPFSGEKIDIAFKIKKVEATPGTGINNTGKQQGVFLSDPILYRKSKRKNLPDVIFISIDTLRQDHLGVYGYSRNTSPNIDHFAKNRQSVVFDDVISQSNWTLPSHVSMFTSQYASVHRIFMDRVIDKDTTMLPVILRNHGFLTSAFATHVRVSPEHGLERGFDYFFYKEHYFANSKARVQDIIPRSIIFLEKYRNEPVFLFIHLFDIHEPYDPPSPFDEIFGNKYEGTVSGYDSLLYARPLDDIFSDAKSELSEEDLQYLVSLYDGEIRNVDYHLGILFDYLKKLDLFDDTLIIITSDHGEEFKEHGGMNHNTLYNEIIRVPLIIKMPKNIKVLNNRIKNEPIQGSIDIAPTILGVLGIKVPKEFQGKSLFPLIEGRKRESSPPFQISERLCYWDLDNYQIALTDKKNKYIYTTFFNIEELKKFKKQNERFELYDLIHDKKELTNLSKNMEGKNIYYNGIIDKFADEHIVVDRRKLAPVKLSKKHIEKLRALGYIK